MNRHPRWIAAAVLLVSVLMVMTAVLLLIAVVRLGVPAGLLGDLTEASGAAVGGGVRA